ncbi:MAG: phenylalanine--tRNA ligase subunit beta [Alphaproteobacteria bacterium]|nr:phenylalanine--tRNA ligase subunit beta [Alphaproteobacteria bacterium]
MKFTLSWLKTHLDTSVSVDALSAKLTDIGLEVEGVHNPGQALAPFVIAQIVTAEQHPNADRLRVCQVNIGKETVQVVCGAPNARAGLKTVFGAPGTFVPGANITLKISKIRDVESRGMLCSGKELQLSAESDGIMELPADAPVGGSFVDYAGLNDPQFEIKLTPNRADCNGVRGIARDAAAAGLGTLKPLAIKQQKPTFKSAIGVNLALSDKDKVACPLFIGRMIKGVKNGPSPKWLQDRLTSIGLKPISALVDITNFMAFDHARPLHVFDASKLKGNIQVRVAKAGEKITALNEKEYTLDETITVIADDEKAHAIAGIMGGLESGCSDATTDVFLECAYFDPARTTLAGRKLGIISDARYRFERGVDIGFMRDATELATQLIIECCGGPENVTVSELVIAGNEAAPKRATTLRPDRCKTLGGLDVPVAEQKQILQALGCTVNSVSGIIDVAFPSWRPDLSMEADCVEEILRIKGYSNIPATSLVRPSSLTVSAFSAPQKKAAMMRRALAARGLLETVTWSFMPSVVAQQFISIHPSLVIKNPINVELDVLRSTILPNLIASAERNSYRGFNDVALFEIGPIYKSAKAEGQQLCAAIVRMGNMPRSWNVKERAVDVFDAKADALAALEAVKAPTGNLQIEPFSAGPVAPQGAEASRQQYFHPGRSGVLRLGPSVLAHFGEIHPRLLKLFGIPHPLVSVEVFLDALPAIKDTGPAKPLADLPDLQAVQRDYAFILARDVAADKLIKAIRAADKDLIANVELFDVYEGKGVQEGHKSLAVSVTLQPRGKTLTDADLDAFSAKVIAAAQKIGASLRS